MRAFRSAGSPLEQQRIVVIFVSAVSCPRHYRLENNRSSPPCNMQPRTTTSTLILLKISKNSDFTAEFLRGTSLLCFKLLYSCDSQLKLGCDAFRFHKHLWSFQVRMPRAHPKLVQLESEWRSLGVHVCFKGPWVIPIALEIVLKLDPFLFSFRQYMNFNIPLFISLIFNSYSSPTVLFSFSPSIK